MRSDRKQFVSLLTEDPRLVLPEGAQILAGAFNPPPALTPMRGHVTSSYHSPTLGRSIALAVVKGGLNRMGETVQVALRDGRNVNATIRQPRLLRPQLGASKCLSHSLPLPRNLSLANAA